MKKTKPGFVFSLTVWSACLALAVIGWWSLLKSAVAPGGTLEMKTDFLGPHPRISEIKPNERLVRTEDGEVVTNRVSETPAYVDVKVPAGYEKVTAKFTVSGEPPIVEIGAMSRSGGQYLMRSGFNRNLDGLDWHQIVSGRIRLYQVTRTYDTLGDFFRNPPLFKYLATYGDTPLPATSLEGYELQSDEQELHLSLRGRHRLRVYLGDENLKLKLATQDMNRTTGEDPVQVAVYADDGSGPLYAVALEDDGNDRDDQVASGIRDLEVDWQPPTPGFYLVDIATSDDVFIRRIFTTQRRLGFVGRVHLGDQIGYWDQPNPVSVRVSGSSLSAKAPTVEGRQTLSVGRQRLEVWQPMHLYEWAIGSGAEFTVNERPLVLYTDGEFGLSDFTYPNERLQTVTARQTPAQDLVDGLSFILADYQPPAQTDDGAYVIEATFDVSELARTPAGAYRFMLWAPMQVDWGDLEIRSAEFTWTRKPYRGIGEWWGQFDRDALEGDHPQDDINSPAGRLFDEYVP